MVVVMRVVVCVIVCVVVCVVVRVIVCVAVAMAMPMAVAVVMRMRMRMRMLVIMLVPVGMVMRVPRVMPTRRAVLMRVIVSVSMTRRFALEVSEFLVQYIIGEFQ